MLSDWKVCLLNTIYTWGIYLNTKAIYVHSQLFGSSEDIKVAEKQRPHYECILRYPFLSYTCFPQFTYKVYYMRVPCFFCEIKIVHNIQKKFNHIWFHNTKWCILRYLVFYVIMGKEALQNIPWRKLGRWYIKVQRKMRIDRANKWPELEVYASTKMLP